MNRRTIAVMAAVGLVTLPSLARAASNLAATSVRIGDWATYVHVMVQFNGNVPTRQVELDKLTGTMALLHVAHPGVTTQTSGHSDAGVHVSLQAGTQALRITASFARHRFKYVSYGRQVRADRLYISLWKSAPPPRGGAVAYRGCLSIRSFHVNKGSVMASGSEYGVFENTFQVVVRGANGSVLGRRTVVQGSPWSTTVKYKALRRQAGTLEAVAFSAKDGALACLDETRVTLPAS
jgi:hypothetical protein